MTTFLHIFQYLYIAWIFTGIVLTGMLFFYMGDRIKKDFGVERITEYIGFTIFFICFSPAGLIHYCYDEIKNYFR